MFSERCRCVFLYRCLSDLTNDGKSPTNPKKKNSNFVPSASPPKMYSKDDRICFESMWPHTVYLVSPQQTHYRSEERLFILPVSPGYQWIPLHTLSLSLLLDYVLCLSFGEGIKASSVTPQSWFLFMYHITKDYTSHSTNPRCWTSLLASWA